MRTRTAYAFLALLPGLALAEVTKAPNVEARHEGIDAAQATALAETLSAARQAYIGQYAFDMPEKVMLEVKCGPKESTRLYTDGQDRLYLSLPSRDKLAKPATSGVFNLYGMCHELGHMAMYRTLKDRDWMSSAAAEGWAHYAGSVVVDHVYATKGGKLWPDPYDYREDGTARLKRQLDSKSKSPPVTQGAGLWLKLEGIIGRTRLPKLFAAWEAASANIDPTDPEKELHAVLVKLVPDKKAALEDWWKTAGPLFTEKRSRSKTKAEVIAISQLSDQTTTLMPDKETADGKKSIAGGGHARRFRSPAGAAWYVKAVYIHGARYGHPKAPAETFDIALCDKDMALIALWKKPYGTFERGDSKWVKIPTPPTRVPEEFNICLDFKPAATKGVYVSIDKSTNGNSQVATPGKPGSQLNEGDWMIGVELAEPKDADALKPQP